MNPAAIVSASLHDPLGCLVLLYLLGVALSGTGVLLFEPIRRRRLH
jgi:hypothetical protein